MTSLEKMGLATDQAKTTKKSESTAQTKKKPSALGKVKKEREDREKLIKATKEGFDFIKVEEGKHQLDRNFQRKSQNY